MKSRTAEKTVELLMTRFNRNPESLVFSRLADEYRKDGNFLKAIEICINGLQVHPEYVTGRIVLGLSYIEQGNYQAAIQELISVLSHDRRNQNAMKMLADLYNRQGKASVAGELYNLINVMDPGNRSVEMVAKQFKYSGSTDVFKILGLPSPQTSFNFKAKESQQSSYQNNIDKTAIESYQTSFEDAQTMSITGEYEAPLPIVNDQLSQVSPDEIGSRMDELFGDIASDGSDAESELIDNNVENILTEETMVNGEIIGDDISDRMNALFDDGSNGSAAGSANRADIPFVDSSSDMLTGDDISAKIGMLDGSTPFEKSDEELLFNQPQSESFNNQMENQDIELASGIDGADINQQIDSLFGNDSDNLQSGSIPSISLDIPESGEELLSGDDLHEHLEKILPDEADSEKNQQSYGIHNDVSNLIDLSYSKAEDTVDTSNNAISGNDFELHIDSITGENDSGEEILSTGQTGDSDFTDVNLMENGHDRNFDMLLNDDEPDNRDSPEIDYGNTLELDNSEQNNLIQNLSDKSFDDSDSLSTDGSIELKDDLITETDNVMDTISGEVTDKRAAESPTGDDFSNHLDMILGNQEKSDEQSIYDKISQNYDSEPESELSISENYDLTDKTAVSGNDISDRIDLFETDRADSTQEEPDSMAPVSPELFTADNLIVSDEEITSSDLSDIVDSISADSLSDNESEKIPDNGMISPFVNTEFEETMQIDRSLIESVQSGNFNNISKVTQSFDQDEDAEKKIDNEEPENVLMDKFDGFDIENETIQIDKEDFDLLALAPQTISSFSPENESDSFNSNIFSDTLILDIDNPLPNPDVAVQDDIQVEPDEKNISEMDVLMSEPSTIQGVTGEDVIEKLDTLFPSAESVDQNSYTIDEPSMSVEKPDNVSDMPASNESISKIFPEFKDSMSTSGTVSGNDVEKRIDEFFSNKRSVPEVNNLGNVEEEQEIDEIDKKGDESFFMTELENEMDIGDDKQSSFQDESDQVIFSDANVSENLPEIPGSQFHEDYSMHVEKRKLPDEIDERDKPYSIPDHVLTPTLADIYYQQGQYQLALQIYSRLLEKDPDNIKLQDRLDEIKQQLTVNVHENPESIEETPDEIDNLQRTKYFSEGIAKTTRGKKKSPETEKPLSGVRIKKTKKSSKK